MARSDEIPTIVTDEKPEGIVRAFEVFGGQLILHYEYVTTSSISQSKHYQNSSNQAPHFNEISQSSKIAKSVIETIKQELLQILLGIKALEDSANRMFLLRNKEAYRYLMPRDLSPHQHLSQILDYDSSAEHLYEITVDALGAISDEAGSFLQLIELQDRLKDLCNRQKIDRLISESNSARETTRLKILCTQIDNHLSIPEIKTLCFHLDIEYDNFFLTTTKTNGVEALVKSVKNHGKVPKLIQELIQSHGNVGWGWWFAFDQYQQPVMSPRKEEGPFGVPGGSGRLTE